MAEIITNLTIQAQDRKIVPTSAARSVVCPNQQRGRRYPGSDHGWIHDDLQQTPLFLKLQCLIQLAALVGHVQ